ncbi:MAG: universal stress protein [Acidobacteriota bacterium]|nr:universal stress protein [Acidobacteriota bacterium]
MTSTLKMNRILFATDFLESSRLALDYAVAFAEHFQATIVMVHVVELSQAAREVEAETAGPSLMRRRAQERLAALAASVKRLNLNVEMYVEDGIPCEVILRDVDRYQADLLVLGVHGVHRGLEHLLIGSNTEKLLLSASCPTLTVGAHVLSGVDLKLHMDEILYFSDFTPEASAAAPYALFLGREFQAPVEVCQLLPSAAEGNPELQREIAADFCEGIQRNIGNGNTDWLSPAFHLERGMEIDQIVERAQSQHAGLIVLGVRWASSLQHHLHSSFVYNLLAKAPCPVLSVRSNDSGDRPGGA